MRDLTTKTRSIPPSSTLFRNFCYKNQNLLLDFFVFFKAGNFDHKIKIPLPLSVIIQSYPTLRGKQHQRVVRQSG